VIGKIGTVEEESGKKGRKGKLIGSEGLELSSGTLSVHTILVQPGIVRK
jgi:hypothetical protein